MDRNNDIVRTETGHNENLPQLTKAELPRKESIEGPVCFFDPRKNPENGWLSNFSSYGITVDGIYWQTTEYFYQACKFMKIAPEIVEKIRSAPTNLKTKRIARKNMNLARSDWHKIKDNVMRFTIATKLEQHRKELIPKLLATGHRQIVEDSPYDYYWGSGAEGRGRNMLGRIWMEVRHVLQREEQLPTAKEAHDQMPAALQSCQTIEGYLRTVSALLVKYPGF